MSRVRSKDTKPELIVRKLAFGIGYRYRIHTKDLPGCPDMVFRSRRKVIFIHGCFWHSGIDMKTALLPDSRSLVSISGVRNSKQTASAMPGTSARSCNRVGKC